MKHKIDIPEGVACDGCILLEAGCSASFDNCRLFPNDSLEYDENIGFIKHKDCPSLRVSATKSKEGEEYETKQKKMKKREVHQQHQRL